LRLLIVTEILTHPTQMGNQQRIYRECLQMKKKGWEIDFLYVGKAIDKGVFLTREFFGERHFFQYYRESMSIKTQLKRKMRKYIDDKGISKFYALKYGCDELYIPGLADKIRYLNEKRKYDVLWLHYMFFSKTLQDLNDFPILKIIDTHDKWANRNRIFQKKKAIPEYFYTTVRQERKALSRADLIIAIQEKEAEYFKKILKGTNTNVLVIGDLVEKRPSSNCNNFYYGCIGAKNKPNILGLEWFCTKVLPIILKKCPESKFIVAGGVCDCISDYPGVYKLGKVKQLEDFYDNVKVAINPIQNGTGLNIKTVESLAFGKPLVTTSIGAKGISSKEKVLFKCDEPDDFADTIITLLKNDELCKYIVKNAQEYIENYNKMNVEILHIIEDYVYK